MNVFSLRDSLVSDYATYIQSFINIRDERIRAHVTEELQQGLLWPDPLIQLNPSFEPGAWIDQLVSAGTLHPACSDIFRLKDNDGTSAPLRLHKHQTDAVEAARSGDNYVLTTGTGSGKSLSYIIPIVDDVLRHGSGKGIRAIVVYPMNALANSQKNELEKFLLRGFGEGKSPVTFRRYTGQEKDEERQEILANPPDVLLTNYVMLELMLTRPRERKIIDAARGVLQFLVLDELHTYRGRQGADVALLVRRVRDISENLSLQCVGTSATLAGGTTFTEQQQQVAKTASVLFGAPVKPERIIGETLRRATVEPDLSEAAYVQALADSVSTPQQFAAHEYDRFIADPLSGWIESTFGLTAEPDSGRLVRAKPISVRRAAERLEKSTGVEAERCTVTIQNRLLDGYRVSQPETPFPVFAFRLHQFISRGDYAYASLEAPEQRKITVHGQQFVPGDRSRILLPMAFCRECGQEYYVVNRHKHKETGKPYYTQRDLTDQNGEDSAETGFLYSNPVKPWPLNEAERNERLPEDWLETTASGTKVKRSRRHKLPQPVTVGTNGEEAPDGDQYHFISTPFSFCLNCAVSYSPYIRSDYGKLAALSSEGRSTATTVLSLSSLRALRRDEHLKREARKLLSFTDNRQDASLQAGHFNDFVEVGLLRAALYRAVQANGEEGVTHEVLPQRVFDALSLPADLYAVDPTVKFQALRDTQRALREVLAYRVYQDLRRGWRVTSPNLEQCGLLQIEYASLDELCHSNEEWHKLHPALADADPERRYQIAKTLLDFLRRDLVLRVDFLDPTYQERVQQSSSQRLVEPWAIDENERMAHAKVAFPRSSRPGDSGEQLYVSSRSGFAGYLRRPGVLPEMPKPLTTDETELVIRQLFEVLRVAGLTEIVVEASPDVADRLTYNGTHYLPHGYQIPASALIWRAGDGTEPFHDPIRVPQKSSEGGRINTFFVDFYTNVAAELQGYEAREHTAQVPSEERERREERFREAALPVLYCSPTMELGVDIAQLNAVNMRNVPPTPANYAQRSGRAGRSGQPALVFTYCTTGSPHDQYFFKRPEQMVAGAVATPRLDLANEDLVRAHVHAIWLAETHLDLKTSLADLLDLNGEEPSLDLLPSVQAAIAGSGAKTRAAKRAERVLRSLEQDLRQASWFHDEWLHNNLAHVETRFNEACERWRSLYRAALRQRTLQNKIIGDASRSSRDKDQAKRLRGEAESQMDLLTDSANVMQSDFYSYRYFASEGFLPGYNFPRLPLSAYVPARRRGRQGQDEYLNRPRFLAIAEFGPRSFIYHEGSRYIVNRVILPVQEREEDGLPTQVAKICPSCGYLHEIVAGLSDPDNCEACDAFMNEKLLSLFRMQNVSTKRRDRINSDEEERMRLGYDLQTAVRLDGGPNRGGIRSGQVIDAAGNVLLNLVYGPAALIWRINLGWRRRKEKEIHGFVLDIERGYWARNEAAVEPDPEDPMSPLVQRVVPFVEDRRNCLLIKPGRVMTKEEMASLQPALKSAIQVLYQVEDNELAAEPLPSIDERNQILLYEAAEGGAGVLRQLFEDHHALQRVAREALRICHFDPDSGEDLGHAPNAAERCEAACYDCLMSYYNQMDHTLLDRKLLHGFLLDLAQGQLQVSPAAETRATHLKRLKTACDSELERTWLDFLEENLLPLPDQAQVLLEPCETRPDFLYSAAATAIYIDGPHHEYANIAADDRRITDCLENAGYTVIRFGVDKSTWPAICNQHPYVFGTAAQNGATPSP